MKESSKMEGYKNNTQKSIVVLYTAAAAAKSLQSCPTLCNPVDCSTPGFPVHHQLLELTQTHVH